MSKLMKDRFDDIGADDDYIAIKYKNFIENEKISAGVRLNALNKVTELRGHFNKEVQQIEGQTIYALSDTDKKVLKAASIKISDKQIEQFLENGELNATITLHIRTSGRIQKERLKSFILLLSHSLPIKMYLLTTLLGLLLLSLARQSLR